MIYKTIVCQLNGLILLILIWILLCITCIFVISFHHLVKICPTANQCKFELWFKVSIQLRRRDAIGSTVTHIFLSKERDYPSSWCFNERCSTHKRWPTSRFPQQIPSRCWRKVCQYWKRARCCQLWLPETSHLPIRAKLHCPNRSQTSWEHPPEAHNRSSPTSSMDVAENAGLWPHHSLTTVAFAEGQDHIPRKNVQVHKVFPQFSNMLHRIKNHMNDSHRVAHEHERRFEGLWAKTS